MLVMPGAVLTTPRDENIGRRILPAITKGDVPRSTLSSQMAFW
jgi:hypothetical protein